MKHSLPSAFLAVLIAAWGNAFAADLVHLEVKQAPVENGKSLEMNFREIKRSEDASTVEVTFISGGSVSSSMFVLRGMCAVARAREATYFTSQRIEGSPTQYTVTFPRERQLPKGMERPGTASSTEKSNHVFSVAECGLLGF